MWLLCFTVIWDRHEVVAAIRCQEPGTAHTHPPHWNICPDPSPRRCRHRTPHWNTCPGDQAGPPRADIHRARAVTGCPRNNGNASCAATPSASYRSPTSAPDDPNRPITSSTPRDGGPDQDWCLQGVCAACHRYKSARRSAARANVGTRVLREKERHPGRLREPRLHVLTDHHRGPASRWPKPHRNLPRRNRHRLTGLQRLQQPSAAYPKPDNGDPAPPHAPTDADRPDPSPLLPRWAAAAFSKFCRTTAPPTPGAAPFHSRLISPRSRRSHRARRRPHMPGRLHRFRTQRQQPDQINHGPLMVANLS